MMDEMELQLRRSAARKMRVFGVLGVLGGLAVLAFGVVADSLRLVGLGIVFLVSGVVQFVRASRHMKGQDDPTFPSHTAG